MAQYKVIQDIEAEDKFVGPLTFRQFLFALGGVFFSAVCFFLLSSFPYALIVFLPLALFGFFMAIPWSKEQSTDVWVLAKIQFIIKPKKRLWDQAGRQDLVTITAPKTIEKHLTKDFSQNEVQGRLKALAETIDSRGWVVKHATASEAAFVGTSDSDRLLSPAVSLEVPDDKPADLPDIMENSRLDNMIDQDKIQRKSQIIEKMDRVRQGMPPEKVNQPELNVEPPSQEEDQPPKNAADRIDELLLSQQIKDKKAVSKLAYGNMSSVAAPSATQITDDDGQTEDEDQTNDSKNKKPEQKTAKKTEAKKTTSAVTDPPSPDIINLARNDDLNVATIARQARRDRSDDGEVVISLH